jgi:hypothetical protein
VRQDGGLHDGVSRAWVEARIMETLSPPGPRPHGFPLFSVRLFPQGAWGAKAAIRMACIADSPRSLAKAPLE